MGGIGYMNGNGIAVVSKEVNAPAAVVWATLVFVRCMISLPSDL
jgi:hypothetical protein